VESDIELLTSGAAKSDFVSRRVGRDFDSVARRESRALRVPRPGCTPPMAARTPVCSSTCDARVEVVGTEEDVVKHGGSLGRCQRVGNERCCGGK
jgi:hypothetical protein